MSRAHLALNVSDLEASLTFSSALFGVESHRRGPRFVNDASDEAALKLLLFEVPADCRREGTTCCCVLQDRVSFSRDPDDAPWEFFTVEDDDPSMRRRRRPFPF